MRAGAEAYGVDLTPEGIKHVQARLALYGLQAAEVRVADAEAVPYPDNTFDLVYSWGVIHYAPSTEKALAELIRVLKPGGTGKVMVYHRNSVTALMLWVRYALLRGRPWRSRADVIWNQFENVCARSFTYGEMRAMLAQHPVENIQIISPVGKWDLFADMGKPRWKQFIQRSIATLMGRERAGWWLRVTFTKKPSI